MIMNLRTNGKAATEPRHPIGALGSAMSSGFPADSLTPAHFFKPPFGNITLNTKICVQIFLVDELLKGRLTFFCSFDDN